MTDNAHEQEDVMEAEHIIDAIKKLIDREKSENEEEDVSDLEDALESMEKFAEEEQKEEEQNEGNESPVEESSEKPGIMDTSVLTGPINGLKNFLIKKSSDHSNV